MNLGDHFFKKLQQDMKLVEILPHLPKLNLKLDPIDPEDYLIDFPTIDSWSPDNRKLHELLLQNGMAEFICNKPFLLGHYRQLNFLEANIASIGPQEFPHLRVLNLTGNRILTLENIRLSLKELYVDYNLISKIEGKQYGIELLSISHNQLDDSSWTSIEKCCRELRCLNVSYNKLMDLEAMVRKMPKKVRILVSFMNAFSLLPHYYPYVTQRLALKHFDGLPYLKDEPKPSKVEEVKEPVPVDPKKDDLKKEDPKKKKTTKQEKIQKIPEIKVEEPIVKISKELTSKDFTEFKINVLISNLENVTGTVFDPTLFPEGSLSQSSYSVSYEFMGKQKRSGMVQFDTATVENEEARINLDMTRTISVSLSDWLEFNRGLYIYLHKFEPKTVIDPENGEAKPSLDANGAVVVTESILGGIFVDLRAMHRLKYKEIAFKYRLFDSAVVKEPFFVDPLINQTQLIKQNKEKFEGKLKEAEAERIKKAAEEQALKNTKKKDGKKAPEKKVVKKEGKEAVVEKKRVQRCEYPLHDKEYCHIGGKMRKCSGQLICVRIS